MKNREAYAGNPVLRGRMKADVAIAGGGFTGLTAALLLAKAGLKVGLVEARRIGYGASGSCCGVLSPAQGLTYAKLEKKNGKEAAQAYARTHLKAIQSICELNEKHGMSFALQERQGKLVSMDGNTAELEEEAEAMKHAGILASMELGESNSPCFSRMLSIRPVYTLNPNLYLKALAAIAGFYGVQCYEGSRVIGIESDIVYTEHGSVQAPYVIVATGYPIINTPGWFFLRMNQRKQEVFRLTGGRKQQNVFFSSDHSFTIIPEENHTLLSIRERLVGTGNGKEHQETVQRWKAWIEAQNAERTETAVETVTPDGLAYIGPYSARTPDLFVGTGYNGNGLAGSMIAAQAIAARILGLPSDGYEIYLPQRSLNGISVPAQIAGNYLKGVFGGSESPRCSHMGCKLVYNSVSRLWECPCHGSRFDDIGRVINAPAVHPAVLGGRK